MMTGVCSSSHLWIPLAKAPRCGEHHLAAAARWSLYSCSQENVEAFSNRSRSTKTQSKRNSVAVEKASAPAFRAQLKKLLAEIRPPKVEPDDV